MSKPVSEKSYMLRRRPHKIRYFFLAVSDVDIHTGVTYGTLQYILKKYEIHQMFVADLVTGKVIEVREGVHAFMNRWRVHYNEPGWNYEHELVESIPAPDFSEEE